MHIQIMTMHILLLSVIIVLIHNYILHDANHLMNCQQFSIYQSFSINVSPMKPTTS